MCLSVCLQVEVSRAAVKVGCLIKASSLWSLSPVSWRTVLRHLLTVFFCHYKSPYTPSHAVPMHLVPPHVTLVCVCGKVCVVR